MWNVNRNKSSLNQILERGQITRWRACSWWLRLRSWITSERATLRRARRLFFRTVRRERARLTVDLNLMVLNFRPRSASSLLPIVLCSFDCSQGRTIQIKKFERPGLVTFFWQWGYCEFVTIFGLYRKKMEKSTLIVEKKVWIWLFKLHLSFHVLSSFMKIFIYKIGIIF